MKHCIFLIICAFSLCLADNATYATPKEFGVEPLKLQAAEHVLPSPMRQWHISGEPPLRAALVRMQGKWGKDAHITLRTPTGRRLELPATALSDADLDAVRGWLKQNNFTVIRTRFNGAPVQGESEFTARILSVSYAHGIAMRNDGPVPVSDRKFLQIRMVEQDGTLLTALCLAQPISDQDLHKEKRSGRLSKDIWVLHEESRKTMLQFMEEHPLPSTPAQLPLASSMPEALACAALRDVSLVCIIFRSRNCPAEQAFRRYLKEHPEAGAIWSQRHVFLIAYLDAAGKYTQQFERDLIQLYRHHNHPIQKLSELNSYLLNQHASKLRGCLFEQPQNAIGQMNTSTRAFEYAPADLQNLKAEEFTFGPGMRRQQ